MQKATCAVLFMLAGVGTVQAGETGSGWYAAARMGYSANVLNDVRGVEGIDGERQTVKLGDSATTRRFMGSLALGMHCCRAGAWKPSTSCRPRRVFVNRPRNPPWEARRSAPRPTPIGRNA